MWTQTYRVKLASCKSAFNPPVVCSTDRSKAVILVLVLLFVALWFILRGDLLYIFPCVILFLCFSVLLVLRLPRLGKRELILVLCVRLFGLCLFGFVGFLFLLGSGKGCGLWLWHSLDFSLTFFTCSSLDLQFCHLASTFGHITGSQIDINFSTSKVRCYSIRIVCVHLGAVIPQCLSEIRLGRFKGNLRSRFVLPWCHWKTLRKPAYSNLLKISLKIFRSDKLWYFSYFCSKYRL